MQIQTKTFTDAMYYFDPDTKTVVDRSRTIAFFLYCKTFHINSVFYKATPRSIGAKIGMSHNTVRKHLRVLKDMELIRENNGNIVFSRAVKRKSVTLYTVAVKKGMSIDNILTLLRNEVLKDNARKQMRIAQIKSYVKKSNEPKARLTSKQNKVVAKFKANNQRVNGQEQEIEVQSEIILSDRKMGILIRKGRQTAHAQKKKAHAMGLVNYTQHTASRRLWDNEILEEGWFFWGGYARKSVTLYTKSLLTLNKNPYFIPKGITAKAEHPLTVALK